MSKAFILKIGIGLAIFAILAGFYSLKNQSAAAQTKKNKTTAGKRRRQRRRKPPRNQNRSVRRASR
jgi:hypothetical protein